MDIKTPPLNEFIDLVGRGSASTQHGYQPAQNRVTVAIYDTAKGCQTLTIRISEDLARKNGLVLGAKMSCCVHPDQQHIALVPSNGKGGASLFRPRHGASLVYQTNLKGGTLEPQKATPAVLSKVDGAVVLSITP
jgi:hypothetical protein